VTREAFLDRAYTPDGRLVPRREPGAVLHDEQEIVRRAVLLAVDGLVPAADGSMLHVRPDTLCLHGDTTGAAGLLGAIRHALLAENVRLAPPEHPADR
jgi:UPF0271 protein